ncbi:MAG: hypothetical protein RBQ97_03995 [Acholeplasma sp.]|nr:hypothetical protein [Acholeplasma sp.]
MKKIGSLVVAILLVVTLVSCNKNKFYATAELENIDNGKNDITFDVKIEDPDSQADGNLYVKLTNANDSSDYKEKTTTKEELEDNAEMSFYSLKLNTRYKLSITTTWNDKTQTLLSTEISTRDEVEKSINTVQEFLEIKNDLYATYNLLADLDFSDITDEQFKTGDIGTFRGVFNGNDHTIKNYKVVTTSNSVGLFGQLSSEAAVSDLVIDGLKISNTEDTKVTGSQYVGILYGQSSSSSVKISKITIKNSDINMIVNSSSSYVRFGLLGGTLSGSASDIVVEDNNNLNVTFNRLNKVYIGGLIGATTSTASINKVKNGGNVNVKVVQNGHKDGEKDITALGLEGDAVSLNVAGLIGYPEETKIDNVITKTKIDLSEMTFYEVKSKTDKDNVKGDVYIDINVAGLLGSVSDKISNIVYAGDISVANARFIRDIKEGEETPKYNYEMLMYVGGFVSHTELHNENFKNVVRVGGTIFVEVQSKSKVVKTGTLFGSASNISYSNSNLFGYQGIIVDSFQGNNTAPVGMREVTDFASFFGENSWIVTKYK